MAAVVPKNFGEANINQHSVKLTFGPDILPDYIVVFLNSELCRYQFDRAATGSSRLALDYSAIRNLQILLPPTLQEQSQIVRELKSKLDRARNLQREAEEIYQKLPGTLS